MGICKRFRRQSRQTNYLDCECISSCSAPCMLTLTFNGSHNDTNSAPYYDYTSDVLYVGDDNGTLHKFTPVFNGGTPAEIITSPWPVALTNSAGMQTTGPVFAINNGIYIGSAKTARRAPPAVISTAWIPRPARSRYRLKSRIVRASWTLRSWTPALDGCTRLRETTLVVTAVSERTAPASFSSPRLSLQVQAVLKRTAGKWHRLLRHGQTHVYRRFRQHIFQLGRSAHRKPLYLRKRRRERENLSNSDYDEHNGYSCRRANSYEQRCHAFADY